MTKEMIEIQLWSGADGPCLYINNYRAYGPKPWGGKPTRTFNVERSEILKALGISEAA